MVQGETKYQFLRAPLWTYSPAACSYRLVRTGSHIVYLSSNVHMRCSCDDFRPQLLTCAPEHAFRCVSPLAHAPLSMIGFGTFVTEDPGHVTRELRLGVALAGVTWTSHTLLKFSTFFPGTHVCRRGYLFEFVRICHSICLLIFFSPHGTLYTASNRVRRVFLAC